MHVADEAKFNPKRLKEARLIRGYSISDLAIDIGVSKQALSQFELGESTPRPDTMMRLINTLGFSKHFFYKEFPEQHVGNTFFRARATATKKSKEVQLNKSLLAGYIFEYLEKFVDFPALNFPDCSEYLEVSWNNQTIDQFAQFIRDYWELGDGPVPNMVNIIERNGGMVFPIDIENEKVDAFFQQRKGRPYVFLGNDKQSAVRRQFDSAHELGHYLMHKHIHNQEVLTREEFKQMESQANRFASAFLLPAESFAKTVTSTSLLHFVELKKYWHVSIGAMLRRCLDLGILDDSRYTSLVKQMSMKKIRIREPLDDVMPVATPTVLKKSILLLLEHKVKNELQLVQEMAIPQEYIEMLCSLEPGTLSYKDPEPIIKLVFK